MFHRWFYICLNLLETSCVLGWLFWPNSLILKCRSYVQRSLSIYFSLLSLVLLSFPSTLESTLELVRLNWLHSIALNSPCQIEIDLLHLPTLFLIYQTLLSSRLNVLSTPHYTNWASSLSILCSVRSWWCSKVRNITIIKQMCWKLHTFSLIDHQPIRM